MTDIRNNYQTQNLQGNVNWTMTAAYHIHYHPPHTLPQSPHTLPDSCGIKIPHTPPRNTDHTPHTHSLPSTSHNGTVQRPATCRHASSCLRSFWTFDLRSWSPLVLTKSISLYSVGVLCPGFWTERLWLSLSL